MLGNHLKDDEYANNPHELLYKETASVISTDIVAEQNFEMLDRLIREKQNTNIITYEAIIMNRTKKTSEWRKNLSPEKKSLMKKYSR